MKKIIAFLLMIACLITVIACKNDGDKGGSGGKEPETPIITESEALVYKGKTEYKIVLSAGKENNNDSVAASELNSFVFEATGVRFPIVYDDQIADAAGGKYISIGHTSLSDEAKIEFDDSLLYRSGFMIKTIGDDVYLLGGTDQYSMGSVYAVYEYLHDILGYEYYAPKCYTLDQVLSVRLNEINKTVVPDIPTRSLSHYTLKNDAEYSMRMRLETNAAKELWAMSGHSINDYANASNYATAHPDWFTSDLQGHCFSNDGLRDHLIEVVKGRIESTIGSKAYLVQIGQADTHSFCNCETCQREIEEKFMTVGGQLIGLINEISDAVTPWLESTYPEKQIYFTTFAYSYSEKPPCVFNEQKNAWEPYSEYVIPRDNVAVYWAPIDMDYSKPIYDTTADTNQFSLQALAGWKALTDKLLVWSYCTNFHHYFVNFDNFGSIAENYRTYAANNAMYIFDEGPDQTGTPTFEELRIYIQAKLLWDTSLDINALIEDFMMNYYGVAGGKIFNYFNELNAYYDYLQSKTRMTGGIYYNIGTTSIWPIGLLNYMATSLDEAIAQVQASDYSDEEKTEYTNRINRLYCSVWYMYLENYKGYFTDSQLDAMQAKFDKTCEIYDIIASSQ